MQVPNKAREKCEDYNETMMLKLYYPPSNLTKFISDTVCCWHNGLSHELSDTKEDLAVAIDFLKRNAMQKAIILISTGQ